MEGKKTPRGKKGTTTKESTDISKIPENAKCFRPNFPENTKSFWPVFPENAKSLAILPQKHSTKYPKSTYQKRIN